MARTVSEIMNPELFSARPGESVESLRICVLGLQVTAVPVLDDLGRPQGMLSLRDMLDPTLETTAAERMTRPAITVREDASIEEAADLLSERNLHHVTVVDGRGVAVGFLSALDVMRGLAGLPISHPSAFPHLDKETGLVWSDDLQPELTQLRTAPDGPGLWILIQGGAAKARRIVWSEGVDSIRKRLVDLVSLPQPSALAHLLGRKHIRVRVAAVTSATERQRVLVLLRAQRRASTTSGP